MTRRTVKKLCIGNGIFLIILGSFLLWQRNDPGRLSFRLTERLAAASIPSDANVPVSIAIPSLNISLPVYPATIENGKWQDTKNGVSYLTSSSVPGTGGNSILYGHNWPALLGNLTKIKPGDKIFVTVFEQGTQVYTVNYITVVTPDQTHILDTTSDSRLTLYTCTGFLDSKRFVVTATKDGKDISLVNHTPGV
jgi:LPXTG-site transpeptidase (sortase) family protein